MYFKLHLCKHKYPEKSPHAGQGQKSPSIWRRWKRLTACQKRGLVVLVFLIFTSYAVGTRLHQLHQKTVHHKHHKKKNHKKITDEANLTIEHDALDTNDPLLKEYEEEKVCGSILPLLIFFSK